MINGVNYGDVVGYALNYVFNRATADSRFGVETAVYPRYAEDYNNDGVYDEGNDQAIYFEPGVASRRVYTTGICTPLIFALGELLDPETVIGYGSAVIRNMTYAEAMQDLVDWFCFAQVEPNTGSFRGGWRYDANWPSSDNSTAQWGALPLLYATEWSEYGLDTPNYVYDELELWVTYIQNPNGGSGYTTPNDYVNVSKTGGLLLQQKAIGFPLSHPRVQSAIGYINTNWNTYPSGSWYGNLNHPYAMWAVYKGLGIYGLTDEVYSDNRLIPIGTGIPNAPGGFVIGFIQDPLVSLPGDWYSHYCDYLVLIQNANGSWSGYDSWYGALATAWYINIIKAGGIAPPPANPDIELTSTYDDPCPWHGDAVHHAARFTYGNPNNPDPTVPPAENVFVEIALNTHMTFVSASGNGVYDDATHSVVWDVGTLADGAERFEYVETVVAPSAPVYSDLVTIAYIRTTTVPPEEWDEDQTVVTTCEFSHPRSASGPPGRISPTTGPPTPPLGATTTMTTIQTC